MSSRLFVLIVFFICQAARGLTPVEAQLSQLLSATSTQPLKRAELLKQFIKGHGSDPLVVDASLLAGLALLKTEEPKSNTEAVALFKSVMTQGRGTWREGIAVVSMANALHVAGEHESVRELAKYALESDVLVKLERANSDVSELMKNELHFNPGFYRDFMLEMLAIAYKSLGQQEEAGRAFAQITNPEIRASFPNGIGIPPSRSQDSPSTQSAYPPKDAARVSQPIMVPLPVGEILEKAKSTSTQAAPCEKPPLSVTWPVVIAMIAAALGLVWLFLKKRR